MNWNLPPRRRNASAAPAKAFEMMLSGLADSPLNTDLKSAMTEAVSNYAHTLKSIERVAGDRTLTDGGRLVRQASVAKSTMSAPLAKLDAAKSRMATGKQATDRELRKFYDYSGSGLAEIMSATEMRGHFRTLGDADRLKAVQTAIDTYDLPTLKALSGAPSVLSNVPEAIHSLCRERLLQTVAPEALARSKRLADEIAFTQNFEDQLLQAVAHSVDFASAAEIEKGAA
jgi:hypothetical protein